MSRKPFDYEQAARLENYVRKRYRDQLKNGELSFYCCALPYLERQGLGLGKPITADYRKLAEAGFRNPGRLREVLASLSGVLCEVETGAPISTGKEATRIRRYTLAELQNGDPRRRLIDTAPPDARKLADLLAARPIAYGTETLRPFWNVLKTGRVQSLKPNVQGHPAAERAAKLTAGLAPGQVLIHADFKRAEPSLIQQAIGYTFRADPYATAAALLEVDRSQAKKKINALAYMPDSLKALTFWNCPPAEDYFREYAEALTVYKEKLFQIGTPRNKGRRYVHTLTGRKIEADRGRAPHRGQVLSWQVQGTVADILNAATLEAIDREAAARWRVLLPLHDALYMAGTPDQAGEIGELMEGTAARFRLPLTVKVETFQA